MISSIKHILKGYDIRVFESLMDFYFIVEEVDVGHVHILQFDDLDGETLIFVIIPNSTIDATAETAAYQVLQIEAVPADAFLSLEWELGRLEVMMGLLGVAGFDVKGAVGAAQLIGLRRCGVGDGD